MAAKAIAIAYEDSAGLCIQLTGQENQRAARQFIQRLFAPDRFSQSDLTGLQPLFPPYGVTAADEKKSNDRKDPRHRAAQRTVKRSYRRVYADRSEGETDNGQQGRNCRHYQRRLRAGRKIGDHRGQQIGNPHRRPQWKSQVRHKRQRQ